TVLHERGATAPADLSAIGRYSDEFARTFSLSYSSIESASDRLGRMAVRELVRRIEGQVGPGEPHVVRFVSPELVDRGSTATPPEVYYPIQACPDAVFMSSEPVRQTV